MNPDVQTMWVDDLRALSNDRQAKGALKNERGNMCCLGVLCEIAVREGIIPSPLPVDGDIGHRYGKQEATAYLPEEVAEWAGLNSMPHLNYEMTLNLPDTAQRNLRADSADIAEVNDSGLYDFDKIADLIETVGFEHSPNRKRN